MEEYQLFWEMITMGIKSKIQVIDMSKEDILLKELDNFYSIEPYEEIRNIKERSTEVSSLLINLQKKDKIAPTIIDAFKTSMESDIPVVLYNVSKNSMAKLCCLGTDTECCIVFPYMKEAKIIDVLDLPLEAGICEGSRTANQESDGSLNLSPPTESSEKPCSVTLFSELSSQEKAKIIETKIETGITKDEHQILAQRNLSTGTSPGALPEHQSKTVYCRIDRDRAVDGTTQQLSNRLLLEVALVASYKDPRCKYLRITSGGAGFNPAGRGNILWDNTYERGYFQSEIEIHIEAQSEDIYTMESSPKNCNNVTQYTTSSSFSVGVDISKDPGFNAQYTISESETHNISDFDITNRSSGTIGDWDFKLGMIKNSIWDMFKDPFMRKGQVKELPSLAKENLQTECVITWLKDDMEFKKLVNVNLGWKTYYLHCWVTGDWTSYTKHYQQWYYHCWTNWTVDYSAVWA